MAITNLLGKAGSLINKIPGGNTSGSLFGNPWIDVSATLQNLGGNAQTGLRNIGSAIVKPAYASGGQVQGASTEPWPQSQQRTSTPPPTNQYGGGGGGLASNTGGQMPNFAPMSPNDKAGPSGPSEMDIINNEYNAMSSYLSGQEGASRENFANFEGQVTRDRDMGLETAGQEQGIRQKELDQTAEGGRQQERLNLQKVRQMLADLDQRNSAQIAISGGGSMNEALADRYNRTALQSQGEVLQEGQNFQNKVALEVERVNQFFDNKKKEIGNWFQTQISQGREELNNRLREIGQARDASAQAKQRATMEAWRGYYDNVNQARIAAADFTARYSNWKSQMDNQLLPALASYQVGSVPGQNISNAMGLFNNQPTASQPQEISALPNTRINMSGARPDEEEQGLFE
jgi:hypothetical protein